MDLTFKNCRLRAFVSTAIIGWGCLALLTSRWPDQMLITILLMLLAVAFSIALLVDFALDGVSDLAAFRQFSLRQFFVVITIFTFYLSLLIEPWTFHLAFSLSRSELERLVECVEAGGEIAPRRAGWFFIERAERKELDGKVFTVLWTNSEAGFVHPDSESFPHNDYSIALRHDPDWSFFSQD